MGSGTDGRDVAGAPRLSGQKETASPLFSLGGIPPRDPSPTQQPAPPSNQPGLVLRAVGGCAAVVWCLAGYGLVILGVGLLAVDGFAGVIAIFMGAGTLVEFYRR